MHPIGPAQYIVPDHILFGQSEQMQQLRQQLNQIAEAGLPVLIEGESGTGKDLLARSIHGRSLRRERAFLKISCCEWNGVPALGEMVFGNKADQENNENDIGSIGTILIDDVGELALGLQGTVSVFLQDPRLSGIGIPPLQVISTTRAPLLAKLVSGAFRTDLFYRANVVSLVLPPLRDRRVDIPALSQYFFEQYSAVQQNNVGPLSTRLVDAFIAADWPGNIRELENAVKRYVLFGSVETIIASLQCRNGVPPAPQPPCSSLKELRRNAVRECEYTAILTSLTRNHWNRRKAAQDLHISYRSLLYIMEQHHFPKKREPASREHSRPAH
jgi:two-component system, NtrC family, response regulator AtoC